MTFSFTLKPWHLAVLAFIAGVGLTAAAALAFTSGGNGASGPSAQVRPSTTAPPAPSTTPVPPRALPTATPEVVVASAASDLCPARQITIKSDEMKAVLDYWNFSADPWNTIVEALNKINAVTPAPYTYDNARASAPFRAALADFSIVVNREIALFVTNRAAGIPERIHAQSLRMGDIFDLERVTYDRLLQSLNRADPNLWNSALDLSLKYDDYYARVAAEIRANCSYLGGGGQ